MPVKSSSTDSTVPGLHSRGSKLKSIGSSMERRLLCYKPEGEQSTRTKAGLVLNTRRASNPRWLGEIPLLREPPRHPRHDALLKKSLNRRLHKSLQEGKAYRQMQNASA